MNTLAREEIRKVLSGHNNVLGKILKIENHSHCRQGTYPSCSQNLSPLELFHFLEPTRDKELVEYEYALHWETEQNNIAYDYDLSSVVGHGQCTYAMFGAQRELEDSFKMVGTEFGTPIFDCSNIAMAVNGNQKYVEKVMAYSKQPATRFNSEEGLLQEFGIWPVVNELVASADLKSKRSIMENIDPRIVSCSDSMNNNICSKIQVVPSTEGYSIALNTNIGAQHYSQASDAEFYKNLNVTK